MISKIFERCIYVRLLNFITENSIIQNSQYGFRKGMSTQTAILRLTEILYDSINSKSYTIAIFVDFAKAFDTINRDILIRKLYRYGIRGKPLKLLQSYS